MRVIISAKQVITEYTKEEQKIIEDALTFENPKFKSAMRFSKYGYTTIPRTLKFYKRIKFEGKDALEVPRFFNLEKCLDKNIWYNKKEVSVPVAIYPQFKLDLRQAQSDAIEKYIFEHHTSYPYPKSIIQLPTGKGKTILAINLASRLHAKTIVLVHKTDLVVGWTKDIKDCFGDIDVGIIQAQKKHISDFITIATVQTIYRMNDKEREELFNSFDLAILDECLKGDSLVVLKDGGVEKIKNCSSFKEVLGGKVSNQFKRMSKIYRLETNHSLLEGSPTHLTYCVPFKGSNHYYKLSECELRNLQDITSDYLVPILYRIPHTTLNATSEKFARLLSVIQCDGHLDSIEKYKSNRVKVNVKKDVDFYNKVFEEGCEELNITYKHSIDKRGNHTFWTSNKEFKYYLINKCCCPSGKKSNKIEVPSFMYYAPIDTIRAYIETCFNCEGDLDTKLRRINFNTCSKIFAQGLSLLLKKFGILSYLYHFSRKSEKHNDVYRLSISGDFFNDFMSIFKLIDRKQCYCKANSKYKNRIDGDYFFSKVRSVVDTGEYDLVYDFTVEDTHSFIANGMLTHNCHNVNDNMFSVIDDFNCKYKLGLSATPIRSDGRNYLFDLYFGGLVYQYEYKEEDEDICSAEVIITPTKYKYKPFLYDGRIFNYYAYKEEDLPEHPLMIEDMEYSDRPNIPHQIIDSDRVNSPKFKFKVCKQIINEYKQGHSILALFSLKEDIRNYYKFLANFIPKDKILLFYGDSTEKVDVMLEKAESKECMITLATYSKAKEGTNVKSWEVLFLVSSINDAKNTEQAVGRIRRKKEDKLETVRVYDYPAEEVYSMKKHLSTRLAVYKKLKFKGDVDYGHKRRNNSIFSRGY